MLRLYQGQMNEKKLIFYCNCFCDYVLHNSTPSTERQSSNGVEVN